MVTSLQLDEMLRQSFDSSSDAGPSTNTTWTPTIVPQAGQASLQRAPVRKRVMGESCDACRTRKIKCDRRERIEATGSDQVVCTSCSDHGLTCTLTKTPKPRLGKRLQQLKGVTPSAERPFSLSSVSLSPSHLSYTDNYVPTLSDFQPSFGGPRPRISACLSGPQTAMTSKFPGLFQIRGLTRELLDAAIVAYFKWGSVASRWVRGADFTLKYRAFFDCYSGIEPSVEPVSEMLILGIAAAGAGLLEHEVIFEGEGDKFSLQEKLLARFVDKVRQQNWAELSDSECVDLVNACYICGYLAIEEGEPDESSDNPFERRPLSDEILASFVFKAKLNRAPKLEPRAPPDGARWRSGRGEQLLTDEEILVRRRTFASLYHHDAFRALAVRRPHFFTEDTHDVEMYLLNERPRYDPGFIPEGPVPALVSPDGEYHPSFEANTVPHLRRLGDLVRKVGPDFYSMSAQTRGIHAAAAESTLDSFLQWFKQTPPQCKFETWLPSNWQAGKSARPQGYAFQKLVRCVWNELLFHAFLLAIADYCRQSGLRSPHESQVTALTARLRRACYDSLFRVAYICRTAGTLELLRCSPVICRNMPISYALWACGQVEQMLAAGFNGDSPSADRLIRAVEDILGATSLVDSAKGTAIMVESLRQTLQTVKQAVAMQVGNKQPSTLAMNGRVAPLTDTLRDEFGISGATGARCASVENLVPAELLEMPDVWELFHCDGPAASCAAMENQAQSSQSLQPAVPAHDGPDSLVESLLR